VSRRLSRVLVANRGEIAVRIIRACHDDGLEAIVTVSDADTDSLAAQLADGVVRIGPPSSTQSYLRVEQVVSAALLAGCDAIHPGYGFLSERPELADACERHDVVFVGPSADTIRRAGDKVAARAMAGAAGVPVGAGSDIVADAAEAGGVANRVGYPVLLKAAAGGGGRGMMRVDHGGELESRFGLASAEAQAAFGDGRLYVERLVENARHVEVQLLADSFGSVVHLGNRDCSVQRRYQKVVEEAPAGRLSADLGARLAAAAVTIGRELSYVGAGTVEFLVDLDREEFSFLEVNTRIQVEHPITEMITGIDIVREQLSVAAGCPLSFSQDDVSFVGHAIECRINAETPDAGFAPSPGTLDVWQPPSGAGVRLDSHAYTGYIVPPYYDSLLGKLIVTGRDRSECIDRLLDALSSFDVQGVNTTIGLHRRIIGHADFRADTINTAWLERVLFATTAPEYATEGVG
jgi:acetyl-CoA carboxylase biotin carboxylase subunit